MPTRPTRSSVTLARALSKLGIASRAVARTLIEDGRVHLNGRVEMNPDHWVHMSNAKISVDGYEKGAARKVYLAMNKPEGYVTTTSDELGRPTVCDLLPKDLPQIFPVGRLDLDTSGLLFFTNDTQWGESITGAEMHVAKRYRVSIGRPLKQADRAALERPMTIDKEQLRPAKLKSVAKNGLEFDITITEGKNRQIRRMCEQLQIPIVALRRVAIGSVGIGTLGPGKARPLTPDEVASFARERERRRRAQTGARRER